MVNEDFFPPIIRNLPEADIPVEGLQSHLFQGDNQQFIFMSFGNDADIPEHSHEAQWGVVLDGAIELCLDGERHVLTKGDTYFIPKGVRHSAKIRKGYKDLTLFDQKVKRKDKEQ
ncbi:MAG: cupin domain-containing protein [FCB group bacterium]|nr:cupin domain-containing protein [FCB group bacterium]